MSEQKCEFNDKGECIHHGAGTQGEAELTNKLVTLVQNKVRSDAAGILETAILVRDMLLPLYEMEAERIRAKGGTPTRPVEREIVELMKPLVEAIKTADAALTALHQVGPAAN